MQFVWKALLPTIVFNKATAALRFGIEAQRATVTALPKSNADIVASRGNRDRQRRGALDRRLNLQPP